jgi:1-deoxy-D-xylulose-5-phosphate synthase
LESLAAAGIALKTLQLGFPDQFVEHGEPAELLAAYGLDASGIENAITSRVTPVAWARFIEESDSFLPENTRIYRGERS